VDLASSERPLHFSWKMKMGSVGKCSKSYTSAALPGKKCSTQFHCSSNGVRRRVLHFYTSFAIAGKVQNKRKKGEKRDGEQ
jgi:hypothetical protein